MHFPSMNVDNSAQNFYYKYPVSLKSVSTAVDNMYHLQPTFHTPKAPRMNEQDPAHAKLASNTAKPIEQSTTQAKQTLHANTAVQFNNHHSSQTKKVQSDDRHKGNTFIASPEKYLYHQQPIVLNPSSVPNRPEAIVNHASYYNPVTPEKYMIRPIYVRLVEKYPGKFMIDQMALNRGTQIPHTHHATLQ